MTGCVKLYNKLKLTLTDAVPGAVFALLLLQPVLDVISYWANEAYFTTITTLFRFAMFAAVMLYAFIISDKKRIYIAFCAVMGVYWVAHMISCFKSANGYISPFSDMNNYLRTVQMPLFMLAFATCFKKSHSVPKYVQLAFLWNFVVMMHFVVVSYMTGTQIYTYGEVGLMGWANVHNSQSAILAFIVPLILFYTYKQNKPYLFYFASVASLLNLFFVGTKVDYFAIPIIALTMVFFLICAKEKKPLYYITLLAVTVACLACYSTSVVNSNVETHTQSMETKQGYVEVLLQQDDGKPALPDHLTPELYDSLDVRTKYDIHKTYDLYLGPMVDEYGFDRVFEKYNYSLVVRELTNTRQQKRNYASLAWEDSNMLTKCFGYEYIQLIKDYQYEDKDGNVVVQTYIYDLENDFPSVFYYSGYVGFAIYMLFIAYFVLLILVGLVTRFKKLFNLESGMIGITFALMLGTSQFSGNVLRRPNASIYMSVILAYIYYLTVIKENVKLRDIFKIFSKNKNF